MSATTDFRPGLEGVIAVETEIGLIEMPASRQRSSPPFDSIHAINSSASGVPCSYSIPV